MGHEKDARGTLSLVSADTDREERDDYALVTDFVMGVLTPAERGRVEQRLERDPAFSRMAARIIATWRSPAFDAALARDGADKLATTPNEVAWTDLCHRVETEGGELGDDRKSVGSDRAADIELPDEVAPTPWYEVLPPSWIVRVGLTAAAALAAAGWIVVSLVGHYRH